MLHDWKKPYASLFLGTALKILDGGTHRPLLFLLEDEKGVSSEWVVKTASMFGGTPLPLLRELVAADLFAFVGLPSPQCALLRLPRKPPSSDATEAGRYAAGLYERDAGTLAFCSSYVAAPVVNRSVFIHRGRMKVSILEDAIKLYAMDLFLWHGDRTRKNPNCLLCGGSLVPIDEHTFFGLEKIDATGFGPDLANELSLETVIQHVAHDLVQKYRSHPIWREIAQTIASLPQNLARLEARWPAELDRSVYSTHPAGFRGEIRRFILHRAPRVLQVLGLGG